MRFWENILLVCIPFLCITISLSNIYPLETEFSILNKSNTCIELRFLSTDEKIFYFKNLEVSFLNISYDNYIIYTHSKYFSNKYPLTIVLCLNNITLYSKKSNLKIKLKYSDANENLYNEEFTLYLLPKEEYTIRRVSISNLTEESYTCYIVKTNINKAFSVKVKYNVSGSSSIKTIFYSTCEFSMISKNEYLLSLNEGKNSCTFCIKIISKEEGFAIIDLYINDRVVDSVKLFVSKKNIIFTSRGYYIDPIVFLIFAYILKKIMQ